MSNAANVKVIARFRPMNELEKTSGNEQVCVFTSPTSLQFNSTREKNVYRYNFDRIFTPSSTQEDIYSFGVKEIIDSVLNGYNGTVLAYGQTSSGKTYTMQGEMEPPSTQGIIPRMISHVFKYIYNTEGTDFIIKVSMIEIYQEKIRDLLDITRVNLNIREDNIKGIYVDGCSERYVGCQLYLVDLAGSEKISKTGATGHTLEEAKIINKSLTTLGRVINNLTDGKSTHVPYRESKLTRVLQESLGGNSKTCLIITCSPSIYNESETLSTLRFGERAKKIKNKPKINKEITVAELQKLVERLKENLKQANARINQLENFIKQNGLKIPESDYKKEDEEEEEKKKEKEEKEKEKDAELKYEEIKKKLDNKKMTIGDRINVTLGLLKEEDTYDNRVEVMANLKIVKDIIENNPGLKDLNANTIIKNAAGENIISGNSNNINVQNNCNKFLARIKGFKEIQGNPELVKLFNGLQNQIKNIKNTGNENSEQSSDSLTKVRNYEDKDIQTEKLEEEYDKVAKKYEMEKRVLQSQIDDKTSEIKDLNNELDRLEQENKVLKDKIPFDEKKAFELNVLLESNLKDLRKKLEQSQVERLTLEDQNNTYVKSMKDKNVLIASLEKQIAEMKANYIQGNVNQPLGVNIIRKISGGIK